MPRDVVLRCKTKANRPVEIVEKPLILNQRPATMVRRLILLSKCAFLQPQMAYDIYFSTIKDSEQASNVFAETCRLSLKAI